MNGFLVIWGTTKSGKLYSRSLYIIAKRFSIFPKTNLHRFVSWMARIRVLSSSSKKLIDQHTRKKKPTQKFK